MQKDRLSDLPDSIIAENILNLLKTKDAVQTRVLSKRWKNLWTYWVTKLDFSIYDYPELGFRFAGFVCRAISKHRSPKLAAFHVSMYNIEDVFFRRHVDMWVQTAIIKGVQDLSLDLSVCLRNIPGLSNSRPRKFRKYKDYTDTGAYTLPRQLYTYDRIEDMSLIACNIAPGSSSVNWKSLTRLRIGNAFLEEHVIYNILQGSPSLRYLKVQDCRGLFTIDVSCSSSLKTLVIDGIGHIDQKVIKICAPNVESLILEGNFCCSECHVLDVPSSLKVAVLNFRQSDYYGMDNDDEKKVYAEYQDWLIELLKKLGHASSLRIGNWCLKVLSLYREVPLSLPSMSCKCLILETQLNKDELAGFTTMVQISQKVTKLQLDSSDICPDQLKFHLPNHLVKDQCLLPEDDSKYSLQRIKEVEIVDSNDRAVKTRDVNDFKCFLLRNAEFLQKKKIRRITLEFDR